MKTSKLQKIVVACLALFASAAMLHAASLTWDADTTTAGAQDGSGTWDTSTANWWSGSADTTFNIVTPDGPTFGTLNGVAGTVTLGASVISSNITFNAPGLGNYTIAGGGNTLGLTNRSIQANVDAAISASIVGSGVTVSHGPANAPGGLLTLAGDNSLLAGTFTIGENGNNQNGVGAPNTTCAIHAGYSTAFGTGTIVFNQQGNQTTPRLELVGGITVTNPITFSGRYPFSPGIESFSGANALSGTVTFGAGGLVYIFQSDAASTLTLSGVTGAGTAVSIQTSGNRRAFFQGTGSGTVSGIIAGGSSAAMVDKAGSGTWTFSGANTYDAPTVVGGGTLTLDYSSQNNSKLADAETLFLAGGTLNLSGGSHTEIVGSTAIIAGGSTVARAGGTGVLRMNAITRSVGGTVDFAAASIADTDTSDVNGILGGYATLAGADWAHSGAGASDTAITAYTGYTDIAALGSTITDSSSSNVRLNSVGTSGNIALGAGTTTVNTLLQNTTTAATVDTSSKTFRLGATGGVFVPGGKQSLTFGTTANSGTLTAGGADNTAGELILINNSANSITVNSTISDNGSGMVSLTKSGSGTATLNGNNTYSGTNYIVGGTLNIGSAANVGTNTIVINGGTLNATASVDLSGRLILLGPSAGFGGGTISVASGQTLTFNGTVITNASTVAGFASFGSLTKTGNGTLVLGGANAYHNTIINGGTVSVTNDNNLGLVPTAFISDSIVLNGGTLDAEGPVTLNANRGIRLGPSGGSGSGTINVGTGQTLIYNGEISDNWAGTGSFIKTGNGILFLGGTVNDYSGNTTVSAGTLQLGNARAIPTGSGGNLAVNGTLDLTNTSVNLTVLNGSGTVDNTGASSVVLTVGYNNTSSAFSGAIQNSGGGALTLTKVGSGTLTLSGASTYTGNTTIANGTLALSGSIVSSNVNITSGGTFALSGSASVGATNINITSGATLDVSGLSSTFTVASGHMLSGSGAVQGNLSSSSGAIISPGGNNVAGTLTVNSNLTLSGSGNLNYDVTAGNSTIGGGVNDLLVINGNLTLNSGTVVNVNAFGGGVPTGVAYTLMQYTGTLTGNPATALSINLGSHYTAIFANDTASSPKRITMTISGSPQNLVWSGASGFAWDQSTLNWSNTATHLADSFSSGDSVTFNDFGNSSSPINLTLAVNPNVITVNNSSTYTFGTTSSGSLGGGTVTKSGAGTLILDTASTYAGPTVINGGVLQVGNADGAGTLGFGSVTNNATLAFNQTNTITVTNNISGSGAVILSGTGNLSLSGSNSYAGLTVVSSTGVLHPKNANALGLATAGLINTNGGKLYIDPNINIDFPNEPLTLGGGTALQKGGATTTTLGGAVTLVSDTTFSVDGGATLNLTNASGIKVSSANANFTLAGTGTGNIGGPLALGTGNLIVSGGTWTVAPSNSYSGLTTINGGALLITGPLSLSQPPALLNPSQVTLNGGTLGTATNVTLNDGTIGITLTANSSIAVNNASSTLTIANDISGDATMTLTKTGSGRLVLNGANDFAGTFNVDSGSTSANDGATVIANNAAIANILVSAGSPFIFIRNNNGGSSTLALDGTLGSITVAPDISLAGRNNTVPAIENIAGNNTISGNITLVVGGGNYEIQSDSGTLTLTAPLPYATPTSLPIRTNTFLGIGNITMSGVIQDYSINGTNISIMVVKLGTGVLNLSAANTYSGLTVVSNGVLSLTGTGIIGSTNGVNVGGGLLVGSGTVVGPVTVQSGGTIEAGTTNTIGTLNLGSTLALSGNTIVKINKNAAGAHDLFSGQTSVTYGGTLTVTNLAGTLTTSDTFTLFSPGASAGNFAGIIGSPGPGLAYSFANGVLSVVGVNTNSPQIQFGVSGDTLTLSWPTNRYWILQSQTNGLSVGLSDNWADVAGSASVTNMNFTINPTNPTVLYRLRLP